MIHGSELVKQCQKRVACRLQVQGIDAMSLKSNRLRGSVLAVIVLGASAAVQPASADVLRYLGPTYGFVTTSGLSNTPTPPPPVTTHPNAGAFSMLNLTAGGPSFAAWCVDIYSFLNTSSSGASYSLTPGTSFYSGSPAVVTALERLASNYLGLVDTKAESGAFQLAVWEIVYEKSGTYSLGTGNFRVTSASDGARTLANTWLANLGTGTPTMTLSVWSSANSQDLAVFGPSPIPEPEIYAMMAVGLGLLGFARRQKQLGRAA
jgi:hypothetical protein